MRCSRCSAVLLLLSRLMFLSAAVERRPASHSQQGGTQRNMHTRRRALQAEQRLGAAAAPLLVGCKLSLLPPRCAAQRLRLPWLGSTHCICQRGPGQVTTEATSRAAATHCIVRCGHRAVALPATTSRPRSLQAPQALPSAPEGGSGLVEGSASRLASSCGARSNRVQLVCEGEHR